MSEQPVPKADNEPAAEHRPRVKVRAWHIVLLIAAVVTCCLLAYWQWQRYKSGTGTFQNLGYALQWPFFGAFFVYAYRMGLKMENEKIDAVNAGESIADLYEADLRRYGSSRGNSSSNGSEAVITEIDEAFLPERPSIEVEEYNALLTPKRNRPSQSKPE